MMVERQFESVSQIIAYLHQGHAGEVTADPITGMAIGVVVTKTQITGDNTGVPGELLGVGEVARKAIDAYYPGTNVNGLESIPDYRLREMVGSPEYRFIRGVIENNGKKA